MNIFLLALLLGAAQGLFLALLLFQRKRNRTANQVLAFLVFFYSLYIADVAFQLVNYQESFPHFIGMATGLPFLFGPLHYLYARFMISPGRRFKKQDWLHFLPFLIFKTYMLPFHLSSAAEKLRFIQNMAEAGEPSALIFFEWAIVLQGNIYMIMSLLLLRTYSRTIKNSFSFYDFVNNYRVEEAKKKLIDPVYQHLTILAIAYEVGFSSKSVFNAAFKKHTSMTPSQLLSRISGYFLVLSFKFGVQVFK